MARAKVFCSYTGMQSRCRARRRTTAGGFLPEDAATEVGSELASTSLSRPRYRYRYTARPVVSHARDQLMQTTPPSLPPTASSRRAAQSPSRGRPGSSARASTRSASRRRCIARVRRNNPVHPIHPFPCHPHLTSRSCYRPAPLGLIAIAVGTIRAPRPCTGPLSDPLGWARAARPPRR